MTNDATKIQQKASNPTLSVWVNASAGTGKTKVLTDRVLRLLLEGVSPEKILCLTFTKAAAAEMSNRLFEILGKWVSVDNETLALSLESLTGRPASDEILTRARRLFAIVLETQGGMKIMNFHSFCQSLLKRFPLEAGVSPYFQIIDENETPLLLRQVASRLSFNKDYFDEFSKFVDESSLFKFVSDTLKDVALFERLFEKYETLEGIETALRQELHLKAEDSVEKIKKDLVPVGDFEEYFFFYITTKYTIRTSKPKSYEGTLEEFHERGEKFLEAHQKILSCQLVQNTLTLLSIIQSILSEYKAEKERRNVLTYDDLIFKVKTLLSKSKMAAWVLYKLDGGLDHILIDEAQDTNPSQWEIVRLLSEEFFAGKGRKDDLSRTLFVVGDRKQSIYRFQGADASEFEKMRHFFEQKIPSNFEQLPMNISFRSSAPILDLVNLVLENKEAEQGILLPDEKAIHIPFRSKDAGIVEIYPVEKDEEKEKFDDWALLSSRIEDKKTGSQKTAQKIADKIECMLQDKEYLVSQKRPIEPKDILILVRKRTSFIPELVRLLKQKNIPVAGTDRLTLKDHIAVKDLVTLGNFLLLPSDDLTLACLLKSPFFGIEEDELLCLCQGRQTSTLFDYLRTVRSDIYEKLTTLLNLVSQISPFELFSYALDIFGGREKFYKRIGIDSKEVLDEFLNLALAYEEQNTPSLQNFLSYFEQTDITIKRDLDQGDLNAIRIMTVHGSKGLQGNIVFLPDTRGGLTPSKNGYLHWKNGLPFWVPRANLNTEYTLSLKESLDEAEKAEYRRLLYVALTRAKDRLYIYGFDKKQKAKEYNWYSMITSSLPDYVEGEIYHMEKTEPSPKTLSEKGLNSAPSMPLTKPDWLEKKAPEEKPLDKPLSPSKLTDEEIEAPSPLQKTSLMRGSYIHALLQKLPNVPKEKWEKVATFMKPEDLTDFNVSAFLQKLEEPVFNHLFAPHSFTEVPIVGTFEGHIISGKVDRLVVLEKEVLLIDYKTNRFVPKDENAVPVLYKKQMSAYKTILEKIFLDKTIKSYLLWTENLNLMELHL
ncbi:MAG: UvrD-helicase domain-containing protein [Alphaproteobacteria bacterium]|nr:UvrD-helicase domain-containing protein [Alphaproteobacteria bacterium]